MNDKWIVYTLSALKDFKCVSCTQTHTAKDSCRHTDISSINHFNVSALCVFKDLTGRTNTHTQRTITHTHTENHHTHTQNHHTHTHTHPASHSAEPKSRSGRRRRRTTIWIHCCPTFSSSPPVLPSESINNAEL